MYDFGDTLYYLIYKITNNINGKIYIGKHKTNDKNDGYMGSGLYLNHAQEKYGIENFTKEILFECSSEEEMNDKERELVNEDFVKRNDTYNLAIGGSGGWYYVNNELTHNNIGNHRRLGFLGLYDKGIDCNRVWRSNLSDKELKSLYLKISNGVREYYETHEGTFKGKHHTDETKKKISIALSEISKGEGNSQYGTKWIHNNSLRENKKIDKDCPLEEGWEDGRVLDWSFLDKTCSVCGCNLGLTKQSKKTKCESCKKKELDKDRKEEYNFYQPMYEDYKKYGWQYVKDKYEYPYSHSNFIQRIKKLFQ